MKRRINKNKLDRIVQETVLKMLKENDENLIKMMVGRERLFENKTVDVDSWRKEMVSLLEEHLGINPDEEESPDIARMRRILMA